MAAGFFFGLGLAFAAIVSALLIILTFLAVMYACDRSGKRRQNARRA